MAAEGTNSTSVPYDQRIARWAVRYLVLTPLTPNMVTVITSYSIHYTKLYDLKNM